MNLQTEYELKQQVTVQGVLGVETGKVTSIEVNSDGVFYTLEMADNSCDRVLPEGHIISAHS